MVKYLFLFLLFLTSKGFSDPVAVYLTWNKSPETTMVIQWLTDKNKTNDQIAFRKIGESKWSYKMGLHYELPTKKEILVHRTELLDLKSGSSYEFTISPNNKTYKFKTIPQTLEKPLTFVVGGDMYHDTLAVLKKTNEQAALKNPYFVLIGGDIAYAASKYSFLSENTNRWIEWLNAWTEQMVTQDGYLIPMLPAIGNHDVNGRYGKTPKQAQSFYSLFAFPGIRGYNVIDFGNTMSILILDSGHTHRIEGDQTKWLQKTLESRQKIPIKFAIYHVPAYPSFRKLTTRSSPEIRKYWVPIFESNGLTAAFENHDHAYKRTHLILGGKPVDSLGVLYIGDGGWGVDKPRTPKGPQEAWYIAKSLASRNFTTVTLEPNGSILIQAFNDLGDQIDQITLKPV